MTFFNFLQLNGGASAKRAKMNLSEGAAGGGGWGEESRRARASGELQRTGGFSKKVRAKDIISPQIDTSSFEGVAPRGREAAALRKNPRRFAAKMNGAEKEKRTDLSLLRI